jgi:nucleoside-diphosphate-sugar epimerase
MKRVLITGAAGNLGGKLTDHLRGRYELRLLDQTAEDAQSIVAADLAQWDAAWVKQFQDVDAVVHLAANPDPTSDWPELLEPNVDAAVNVFHAAALAGVARLVFASSNHALGQYKDRAEPHRITGETPPLPGTHWTMDDKLQDSTPYGAFKVAAERILRCYTAIYPMQAVAVRIGWNMDGENDAAAIGPATDEWTRLMWLSNRDYCQLLERAITADLGDRRLVIVNGMSANRGMRWDLTDARTLLGYQPQDDVTKAN